MGRNESPYVLWICKSCGQEVLGHRYHRPNKFCWSDGHVCHFRQVEDNGRGLNVRRFV
jgi:hypothetical protein